MKKLLLVATLVAGTILFQQCSTSKKAAATAAESVSFEKDIAGMMKTSCSPCHFPPDGKKEALDSYEAVSKHIDEVIERVKLPQTDIRFMPFKIKKPALSDSAIAVLVKWKEQGMAK